MNKKELIEVTAMVTGLTKKDSERAINAALDVMTATLARGERVQLSGFGTFEVRHREARSARNLQTEEPLEVPETNVPTFKPSETLKKKVGK